jgi:hypothetical protein
MIKKILCACVIVGILTILFMAEPVWGLLPKAQDNPETIEEAIVRLIDVHLADQSAHAEEEQSLFIHKAQDTIDHKALSIVPDKFSTAEVYKQTLFETLDSWDIDGSWSVQLGNLWALVFGDDAGDKWIAQEGISFSYEDIGFTILNNQWQTDFSYFAFNDIADFVFGMGVHDSYTPSTESLFFKIESGELITGYGNGSTISEVSYGNINQNQFYSVRVLTEKVAQEAYFYLDDVLIRTVDISEMSEPSFNIWGVYAKKTGGTTNAQSTSLKFKYLSWGTERI